MKNLKDTLVESLRIGLNDKPEATQITDEFDHKNCLMIDLDLSIDKFNMYLFEMMIDYVIDNGVIKKREQDNEYFITARQSKKYAKNPMSLNELRVFATSDNSILYCIIKTQSNIGALIFINPIYNKNIVNFLTKLQDKRKQSFIQQCCVNEFISGIGIKDWDELFDELTPQYYNSKCDIMISNKDLEILIDDLS